MNYKKDSAFSTFFVKYEQTLKNGISGLGKWSGYLSQSKPGYTTFKRGLDNLYSKSEFLKIVKDVYKG